MAFTTNCIYCFGILKNGFTKCHNMTSSFNFHVHLQLSSVGDWLILSMVQSLLMTMTWSMVAPPTTYVIQASMCKGIAPGLVRLMEGGLIISHHAKVGIVMKFYSVQLEINLLLEEYTLFIFSCLLFGF